MLYRLEDGNIIDRCGNYIASVLSDDCVLLYKYIWLPRQDQLQEMVKSYESLDILLRRFHGWYLAQYYDGQIDGITSMEQLWLAFVMKELYYKKWNSETNEWD